jgi:hypothetical protein
MSDQHDSTVGKLGGVASASPATAAPTAADSQAANLDRALVAVRGQLEQELFKGRDELRHVAYLRGHRAAVAPWYRQQVEADIAALERRGAESVARSLRCLHALDQIRQDPRDLGTKLEVAGLAGRFEQSWREAFGEQPSPLKATPRAYELAALRERPASPRSAERRFHEPYWGPERDRDRD